MFSDLSASYLRPTNVIGAYLIDRFHFGLFNTFGFINLAILTFAIVSFYHYLYMYKYNSRNWALFGAIVYLVMPTTLQPSYVINYLGIFAWFPFLLILYERYLIKRSPQNILALVFVLSIPIFWGSINIYINYLFMSTFYMLYVSYGSNYFRKKDYAIIVLVILASLAINSIIWGPLAFSIMDSYSIKHYTDTDLSIINPIILPVQLITGILLDHNPISFFSDYFNLIMGRAVPLIYYTSALWLTGSSLGMIFLIVSQYYAIKQKKIGIEYLWLWTLIIACMTFYLFFAINHKIPDIISVLKPLKYQAIIGGPFIAVMITDGVKAIIEKKTSLREEKFLRKILISLVMIYAFFLIIVFLIKSVLDFVISSSAAHILLNIVNYKFLHFSPSKLAYFIDVIVAKFNLIFKCPEIKLDFHWTTHNIFLYLGYFLFINLSLIFMYVNIAKQRTIFNKRVVVLSIIIVLAYYPFIEWGGFVTKNEIFADDFFKIQENELLVKRLGEQEYSLYRTLYFDDACLYKEMNLEKKLIDLPKEITERCGKYIGANSMYFIKRPEYIGIPTPDGLVSFPNKRKADYFSNTRLFTTSNYAMVKRINNLYDPALPEQLSVKYIISHFPLAGFKLLNQTNDYWRYLYLIKDARPIIGLIDDSKGKITFADINSDNIKINISSPIDTFLKINLMFDKYWNIYLNGKKINLIEKSIFNIPIKAGNSEVIMKYDYKLVKYFATASLCSLFFAIYGVTVFSKKIIGSSNNIQPSNS